jgi:hypothetical protein
MKLLCCSKSTVVAIFVAILLGSSSAWIPSPSRHIIACSSSRLYSTPRQPRRKLQKRRKRQEKQVATPDDAFWQTAESRPLVNKKERGEDYWIDEEELKRAQERTETLKRRDPGQVPDEKLWNEVLSPYRDNWIGFISVFIVILAAIITKFPELLDQPAITIPDL